MDNEKNTPPAESATSSTNSFEALPTPAPARRPLRMPSVAPKTGGPNRTKTPPNNNNTLITRIILIVVIIVVVAFGAGWLGSLVHGNNSPSAETAKEIVTSHDQLVTAIAKNVSPSVVSITADGTAQADNGAGFETNTPTESAGTGIIISKSGYVMTNRHVIPSGTTSVSVTLADGTTINNVKVVGTTASSDPLDIAFLKISGSPETLQPAQFGDSSKIQVGDTVVAIGNALGQFQNTVTSGILSGRGRTVQAGDSSGTTSEDLQDLLQTDAPINEGNSGGPLIDTSGLVIGINTALASDGAQNIGFSIPINDVEGLIKGVLNTSTIERPYLGVYYTTITPATARQYGLSVQNGAYVAQNQQGQSSIIAGSPAANAGLQPGDVITAVNGVPVNLNNSLSSLIDENQVGTHLTLTVIRSGSTKQIAITVGQEPSN